MCDSTGDACWESSVCLFSRSTHIKMLTCVMYLQVCVCARACVTGQATWGEWRGRGGPLISVDPSLYSPPEPLKTVVLGWEKYTGETWWRSSVRSLAVWKVCMSWKTATGKWSLQTQWEFIISTQGEVRVWGGNALPVISRSLRGVSETPPSSKMGKPGSL